MLLGPHRYHDFFEFSLLPRLDNQVRATRVQFMSIETQAPVNPAPAAAVAPESPSQPKAIPQLLSPEFMARLGQLSVISKKILAGKLRGERRSKKRGESLEFA